MPYSYITLAQAKQLLAQRNYDLFELFASDSENAAYILESLQTFNALANFYRQEFTFLGRQNIAWYDVTDVANLPNTTRPLTTTDTALVEIIEYHLLEPQTSSYPLMWTGSKQFTITDLLNAIQQARDQLISESTCTLTESLIAAVPGRTFMIDTAIDLRRVAWIPAVLGFQPNTLMPADIWADQSFEAGFVQQAPGYPNTYRRSTEPPLSFDVDVQPGVPGQYDILTANAGTALSAATPSILPIPNDWCWVAKFGAMAQLFGRDSVPRDSFRAQYCDARFKQGIAAMVSAPAVLAGRINDVPISIEALTSADYYRANWQALTPGTPDSIYHAGLNILALAPVPDSNNTHSVTVSVVSNMVLPATDSQYLQIGRDDVNAVIGYAQHLAMLKSGGAEFAQTFPLYTDFLRHCSLYNSKLSALSSYLEFIDGLSREDKQIKPVFNKPDPEMVK